MFNKCPKCNEELKLETLPSNDKKKVHEHMYCSNHYGDGFYCLTEKTAIGLFHKFS